MGLVTSNLAQMDRAILFQSIGRWFKSIISLFTLTSAFPSLSIHIDIFFQAVVVISLLFLYNTLKKTTTNGKV